MKRLRSIPLLACLSIVLLLGGCSFTDATQVDGSLGAGSPLDGTRTVGQTFVAQHDGLSGISVLAALDGPAGAGRAVLHLRADPTSGQDLAQASLPLAEVSGPGFYTFSFPALHDTHGQRYYFVIETHDLPEGSALTVWRGPGQAYADGAMYRSGQPRDRQLTFRLHYAWPQLLAGALLDSLADLGVMLAGLALFVLPGWALLAYLLPEQQLAWAEKAGLAAGLSLSIYPLVLVWGRTLGVQPGAWTAWGPLAIAALVLAWRQRHALHTPPHAVYAALHGWLSSPAFWPDASLALVGLLVFGVRLFVIRGQAVPLWGDSVQHAAISQLLVDHAGLFDSWLPYAAFQTFTMHFGFHSDVAAWHWLTGGAIPHDTLVTGQLVNFLACLALVPLASRLFQSRWAGLGALLVAGLFSPLPMEYVNWGRYSQLAGQAVLPVAVWLTWELAETKAKQACAIAPLIGLALAGMFLSYYRMPYYYGAAVIAWSLACGLPRWRVNWQAWGRWGIGLLASGLIMLALVAPWLVHISGSKLAEAVGQNIAQASPLQFVLNEYEQWRDLPLYVPTTMLALAGAGLLWAALRRRGAAAAVGLWAVGLASLVATRLTGLPGAEHMTNFASMISLYIPLGLLGGCLLDAGLDWLSHHVKSWGQVVAASLAIGIALWGAKERSAVINLTYRMVAPADLAAMEWIQANTLPDALFLVDGFLIYEGYSAVGSDAGWWIPLLASRHNSMPPQYALLNEQPYQPGYTQELVALVAQVRQAGITSPDTVHLLCQHGITHVYVGQAQGRIGVPPPEPMLALADLENSPYFTPVYRQDKVGVFALDTQQCDRLSLSSPAAAPPERINP